MTDSKFQVNQTLKFTKTTRVNWSSRCQINDGDFAVYIGNSRARLLTGPIKGKIVILGIDAPVISVD